MTDPGFSRSQNRPVPRPSIAAQANGKAKPSWRDFAISAPDLCDEQFPSVRFLIPGLIPEGVMLLVGRPKLGKSWLLLQIASSVAQGAITLTSDHNTPQACGDALHLSLEDGKRRLQRRMTKYFGAIRRNWPARMTIVPQWRRLDQGGIDDIREWCKSVPNPTLVTIDTLKKVRPTTKGTETSYATDYEANEKLIQLCHEFPGLAIIVAHHDRKMDADDPFDTISGTLGLTGGVDTIALLKRSGQGITLHIQGRDLVDNVEKAVQLDRETCRWIILGEASDVQRSKDWRLVLDALHTAGNDGLTVKAIMDETGLRARNSLDLLLGRMVREGAIVRPKRGIYAVSSAAP
jgi:AAA domain